ncbi:NUDIX domain-containing protein [Frankia sp. CNm7]|uniref:NUDIX domain-containing protein n=1 Tax=Frankia nepalensis TaxID=1836974 RepID=A0A937RB49_9ACTN|nr:NUDIX domain-containing protein [Frankia nepalensis]MBL7501930.1 NUDIX domain-containing protein [Frankia nepalensis]MBL7514531.1 NUDIX domain-containing protein [Frankia nepalensis]MBL7524183.1 NUDIX domain-containing protein [Frankia nepalensis]MBL7628806.1 NUDIX domain-containing protein [Frankia nepalensis]
MGRIDYYHDPNAPAANALVVGGCAVVPDGDGRILLQRRADNGEWALPGGGMDIGETLAGCVIREVREETGFDIIIERIVGVYSDPGHVFAYDNGEIRQQFSICLAGRIVGGAPAVSDESTAVAFFTTDEIERLDVHESHRVRIRDYLAAAPAVLR